MAPRKLDPEIPVEGEEGNKADELQRQASNKQLDALCNHALRAATRSKGDANRLKHQSQHVQKQQSCHAIHRTRDRAELPAIDDHDARKSQVIRRPNQRRSPERSHHEDAEKRMAGDVGREKNRRDMAEDFHQQPRNDKERIQRSLVADACEDVGRDQDRKGGEHKSVADGSGLEGVETVSSLHSAGGNRVRSLMDLSTMIVVREKRGEAKPSRAPFQHRYTATGCQR